MANIESVKTDINKEVNGVWVDFAEGIRLLIARSGNSKYVKILKELTEPHLAQVRNGTIEDELYTSIVKKAKAQGILVGWQNIEDETGMEISYSSEKALEFFMDPELKDFYNFVTIQSQAIDNYRKILVKDAEEN